MAVPRAELSVGPHLSWLLTGVPDAFLNVVFRTDLPPDRPGEIVDEALRHFRFRHVSKLSWWADTPGGDIGQHLMSRGLTFNANGTAMAADVRSVQDNMPTPGLEIVPVEDRAALQAWIQVMRVGFGLPGLAQRQLLELFAAVALEPPMHTFLAMLDRQPVRHLELFLGAGVAGIYNVTCLPEARGIGPWVAIIILGRSGGRTLVLPGPSHGVTLVRFPGSRT